MKALVFKRPGEWAVETLADPTPGPGELVMKVCRCGICGTDLHRTSGEGATYAANTVAGHEYAGEVIALGKGVAGFRVGERVAAMPFAGCGQCPPCRAGDELLCAKRVYYSNGFADYVRIAASSTIRLPQNLSDADGALVEPLAVGLHGAQFAGPVAGMKVLVLGAGPIGLSVIHALRHLGAGRIAVLNRSTRRADLASNMGADAFVTTGDDEAAHVSAALGDQPDIVFECIGVRGALDQCIRHVKPNGHVVSLGSCGTPDPVAVNVAAFKQARLFFSSGYSLAEFQAAADHLSAGRVAPRAMLSDVVSLRETPAAFDRLRAGHGVKVQVDPRIDG